MNIKNIKINSYGNLKDKEYSLSKLNIIYGQNESGKTTLQNFILSMFFGIDKKKGKNPFSDEIRYTPWQNDGIFSGKISYELDNKKYFEVYRDFNKKNPEIYDESGKDISKDYNIDKRNGSTFFEDQVGLDRDIVEKTVFAKQNAIKIGQEDQELLIQKVSNIIESGDEETSFKSAISSLNRQKLNEVGTEKSKDRPINIAKSKIEKYEAELKDIEFARDNKSEIENAIKDYEEQIKLAKNKKVTYEKIKKIVDENNLEQEKITAKESLIDENEIKINKIKEEIKNLNKKKNNKKDILWIVISIIINILSIILIKNKIVNILIFLLIPIFIAKLILSNKKNSSTSLSEELKAIESNNEKIISDVEEQKHNLQVKNNNAKTNLIYANGEDIKELFNSNIDLAIEKNNKNIEELELDKHKSELDYKDIEPKMEKISHIEELLEIEKENLKKLEERQEDFDIAKELLTRAYNEMKKNITPKFNNDFEEYIKVFTDNKYKRVLINEKILVELNNGQFVDIEQLSYGTIQEIYLALRLAMIKELSNENLPIILDEPFAYFDDKRIQNVMNSLSQLDSQIIIFTCTNREKSIIDNMNLEYNYIEI